MHLSGSSLGRAEAWTSDSVPNLRTHQYQVPPTSPALSSSRMVAGSIPASTNRAPAHSPPYPAPTTQTSTSDVIGCTVATYVRIPSRQHAHVRVRVGQHPCKPRVGLGQVDQSRVLCSDRRAERDERPSRWRFHPHLPRLLNRNIQECQGLAGGAHLPVALWPGVEPDVPLEVVAQT